MHVGESARTSGLTVKLIDIVPGGPNSYTFAVFQVFNRRGNLLDTVSLREYSSEIAARQLRICTANIFPGTFNTRAYAKVKIMPYHNSTNDTMNSTNTTFAW